MLVLLLVLQWVFGIVLENIIEQCLVVDVVILVLVVWVEKGCLVMFEYLLVEEFNLLEVKVFGYIYDQNGDLFWCFILVVDELINYMLCYDGCGNEFYIICDVKGEEFFVFDVEIDLLCGKQVVYSIVIM